MLNYTKIQHLYVKNNFKKCCKHRTCYLFLSRIGNKKYFSIKLFPASTPLSLHDAGIKQNEKVIRMERWNNGMMKRIICGQ